MTQKDIEVEIEKLRNFLREDTILAYKGILPPETIENTITYWDNKFLSLVRTALSKIKEDTERRVVDKAIENISKPVPKQYDGNNLKSAENFYGISAKDWREIIRIEDGMDLERERIKSILITLSTKEEKK